MVRSFVAAALVCAAPTFAFGQDRFVERTPSRHVPLVHTMERAGYPTSVKPHAIPSVPPQYTGGYIGGARLFHGNRPLAKGPYAAPGPVRDGTYGIDYAGITMRPGRVFLAPSYDPSIGPTIAQSYRAEGPVVPDVFSLRPLRKAVIEAREDKHGGGEEGKPE
ncbi:hypothetical protein [Gemmata sp.]|uniref:hypothetical protein n=1 Tax=Gemmata sp. TaxID=1914242 RepID=UPI003F6EF1E8